eukprot:g6041.t1
MIRILIFTLFSLFEICRTSITKQGSLEYEDLEWLQGNPSVKRADYEFVRLKVLRGERQTEQNQFAVVGAVFRVDFDRSLFLERFNGFNFTSSPLPISSPVHTSDPIEFDTVGPHMNGLTRLHCKGFHTETGVPSWNYGFQDQTHSIIWPIHTEFTGKPGLPLHWHLASWPQTSQESDILHSLLARSSILLDPMAVASDAADILTSSFRAVLLLQIEDENGKLYKSPLLRSEASEPTKPVSMKALRRLLSNCQLTFLPHSQQRLWPVSTLVDESGRKIPESIQLAKQDIHAKLPNSPFPPLLEIVHNDWGGTTKLGTLAHYHRIATGWSKIVPPMPEFCGMRHGELDEEHVRLLRAHHETAFLESRSKARTKAGGLKIPGLDKIINVLMKIAMPPTMEPVSESIQEATETSVGSQMSAASGSAAPWQLFHALVPSLRANITNILSDVLPLRLTENLAEGLLMDLGPRVKSDVVQKASPIVAESVTTFLSSAIPQKISSVLPSLLERSLPRPLTEDLTQSVTHAVVPILTQGLTHNSQQDIWCYECYTKNRHCSKCHYSPEGQYYTNYYSSYYSDYFAGYYSNYYGKSLHEVDMAQHGYYGSNKDDRSWKEDTYEEFEGTEPVERDANKIAVRNAGINPNKEEGGSKGKKSGGKGKKSSSGEKVNKDEKRVPKRLGLPVYRDGKLLPYNELSSSRSYRGYAPEMSPSGLFPSSPLTQHTE